MIDVGGNSQQELQARCGDEFQSFGPAERGDRAPRRSALTPHVITELIFNASRRPSWGEGLDSPAASPCFVPGQVCPESSAFGLETVGGVGSWSMPPATAGVSSVAPHNHAPIVIFASRFTNGCL
jgi:hypothetical protein